MRERAARAGLGAFVAFVAVALWLSASGCPGAQRRPSEPDPVAAVIAYRDALVEGRVADAFALIHPSAREGLDRAGFEALYRRHRDTLVAQAEALVARARAAEPELRATVEVGDAVVDLVRTREGWRLLWPVGATGEAEAPR